MKDWFKSKNCGVFDQKMCFLQLCCSSTESLNRECLVWMKTSASSFWLVNSFLTIFSPKTIEFGHFSTDFSSKFFQVLEAIYSNIRKFSRFFTCNLGHAEKKYVRAEWLLERNSPTLEYSRNYAFFQEFCNPASSNFKPDTLLLPCRSKLNWSTQGRCRRLRVCSTLPIEIQQIS